MNERRKRRFHLSSVGLVLAAAGLLLWANVHKQYQFGHVSLVPAYGYVRGWPFVIAHWDGTDERNTPPHWEALILNPVLSIALLALVFSVAQYFNGFRDEHRLAGKPAWSWFRIHLSTTILVTLTAGVCLWANLQENRVIPEWADNEPARVFGWPATAITFYSAFALRTANDVRVYSYAGVLLDIGAGLGLMIAIAVASESLIRRRETGRR